MYELSVLWSFIPGGISKLISVSFIKRPFLSDLIAYVLLTRIILLDTKNRFLRGPHGKMHIKLQKLAFCFLLYFFLKKNQMLVGSFILFPCRLHSRLIILVCSVVRKKWRKRKKTIYTSLLSIVNSRMIPKEVTSRICCSGGVCVFVTWGVFGWM